MWESGKIYFVFLKYSCSLPFKIDQIMWYVIFEDDIWLKQTKIVIF